MYNLIIVDDEERVLEAMNEIINWEELNVHIIGLCDNALSALQLMINEEIDILVTDIKMPIMDGLELISRAKEMHPNIECITLSGYEEFDLAREAISLGVRRYLLKPCSKEELIESIQLCVKSIDNQQRHIHVEPEMRQQLIEQTYERLINLQLLRLESQEQVKRVSECAKDHSIIREAIILVAIHYGQSFQKLQPIMANIVKTQNPQELFLLAVKILLDIANERRVRDPIVAKVIRYVYDNYDKPSLTLQYIADNEIHLTVRYIGQRFLNEMNMKFSDFLLQVRIEKAIELLQKKDFSSSAEIADQVGLGNNVHYFYRLFRQYTGMTLKEYKSKILNDDKSINKYV